MKGKIKWYNWRKGFGFIITAGGNELFVHKKALTQFNGKQVIKLAEGQAVEFEITEGEKGPEAANVEIIQE